MSKLKMKEVEGMDSFVVWNNYDPDDWRKHPDPEEDASGNDDEEGWSPDLEGILGFDPASIDW